MCGGAPARRRQYRVCRASAQPGQRRSQVAPFPQLAPVHAYAAIHTVTHAPVLQLAICGGFCITGLGVRRLFCAPAAGPLPHAPHLRAVWCHSPHTSRSGRLSVCKTRIFRAPLCLVSRQACASSRGAGQLRSPDCPAGFLGGCVNIPRTRSPDCPSLPRAHKSLYNRINHVVQALHGALPR